jgi:hypothetical protein
MWAYAAYVLAYVDGMRRFKATKVQHIHAMGSIANACLRDPCNGSI